MRDIACDAINDKKVVEFSYDGYHRQVEPYKFGVSTAGNIVLTGFQIGGGSSSGKNKGFKMFKIDEIWDLTITDQEFREPQQGYSTTDKRLNQIHCQV